MATWIVHLRIAENLLERIPGLDAGQFAIGNIAPDSGVPDEKWEHFDPPPEVTHFKRNKDVHKDIADLDFKHKYLEGIDPADAGRFSFRLGYFFHLVTDNLWTIEIGRPTQERWQAQFAADRNFIWEVKQDWYGLDQLYVRTHPGSLFWRVFLDAQPDSCDLDFIPAPAIARQLQYIKDFYRETGEKIDAMVRRPFIYLPQSEMDRFVDAATERLFRIHHALWVERIATSAVASALTLVN
jgi:hypothetical protein